MTQGAASLPHPVSSAIELGKYPSVWCAVVAVLTKASAARVSVSWAGMGIGVRRLISQLPALG